MRHTLNAGRHVLHGAHAQPPLPHCVIEQRLRLFRETAAILLLVRSCASPGHADGADEGLFEVFRFRDL